MRHLRTLPLLLLTALVLHGCTDTTTQPTVNLGETTLDQFLENAGYRVWYDVGYDAYPESIVQAEYDSAVSKIAAKISAGEQDYTMMMVVKPNCGCQHTQVEMPKVMKTLDDAGFPHEDIQIWVTDSPLNGIDDIKESYDIRMAPTFILLEGNSELGRIEVDEATVGAGISTMLSTMFVK